jgi:hypothetical protein
MGGRESFLFPCPSQYSPSGLYAKEHPSTRSLLVPAVMTLTALAWTVSPACADVILTVTNGASPGTFNVAASGSTVSPASGSDGVVDVVNLSSSVISQLAVQSTITNTFNDFDGDGPFGGGGYNGPNQTFTNVNGEGTLADVNFTGATIYGPLGLAPGATGYFGVEGYDPSNSSTTFNGNDFSATVTQASPIPEPGTMMIFGLGLAGLVGYRLRRKQSA